MANFDDFKLAIEALSGGKNTVILDDRGMPSVMVPFPKLKMSDLIEKGSQELHPAFKVNTVEKNVMYVSKFINVVINDRAYSLPLKDPKTSVNFDTAVQYCRNKGKGWGLMPYSLWCAVALWCKKNGTMPRGNNNWGHDHQYTHEAGIPTTYETGDSHKGEPAHTATGSGPDTWNHNWQPDGIADLNGNVWEWTAGARLKNGLWQVIPYADCMDQSVSLLDGSSAWKAIKSDGTLVDISAEDTLKWDWKDGKLQLTNKTVAYATDQGNGCPYKDMTLVEGLEAPELAKALLLYPDKPNEDVYGGDYHWANVTGERLPLCGGGWGDTSGAGVFSVLLRNPRAYAHANLGFRAAYCDL